MSFIIVGIKNDPINKTTQIKAIGNRSGDPFKDQEKCDRAFNYLNKNKVPGTSILKIEITSLDKA